MTVNYDEHGAGVDIDEEEDSNAETDTNFDEDKETYIPSLKLVYLKKLELKEMKNVIVG